jgi:hypothetical protein
MTELAALRQLADLAAIRGDREGCIRAHAILAAIESLLIRIDRVEMLYGIVPGEQRREQHLNG